MQSIPKLRGQKRSRNLILEIYFTDCTDEQDIVFVLDGSDSMSADEFIYLKISLVRIVNYFHFSEKYIRCGLVLFGNIVTTQIPLCANKNQFITDVMALTQSGDSTRTDLGKLRNIRKASCYLYKHIIYTCRLGIYSDLLHTRRLVLAKMNGYMFGTICIHVSFMLRR